ncbi:hypothetical protein [Komagataeibacter intermedius]|nr:hypothetical protein [Komagataeibacter intermedius]
MGATASRRPMGAGGWRWRRPFLPRKDVEQFKERVFHERAGVAHGQPG